MNLILVDSPLNKQKFPADDRRSVHIRKIGGKKLFVGIPNGQIGLADVSISAQGDVELVVHWLGQDPTIVESKRLITLLIPYCRPQTCRKILREAGPLGIKKLVFFISGKSEVGYAQSSLWKSDEWRDQLYHGVEQSFSTFVPEIELTGLPIEQALEFCKANVGGFQKIALDNYESSAPIGEGVASGCELLLAIGPERGWSAKERELLLNAGFKLSHMGPLVMRTETAVATACGVLNFLLGTWQYDTKGMLDRLESELI